MSDDYERGYERGYDSGWDAGFNAAKEEVYEDFMRDYNIKQPGKPDNLCLKCDCREYGFDCALEDPRAYIQNRLNNNPPKRSLKRVINKAYDRAMEMFIP
jgi:hypothetical protein